MEPEQPERRSAPAHAESAAATKRRRLGRGECDEEFIDPSAQAWRESGHPVSSPNLISQPDFRALCPSLACPHLTPSPRPKPGASARLVTASHGTAAASKNPCDSSGYAAYAVIH